MKKFLFTVILFLLASSASAQLNRYELDLLGKLSTLEQPNKKVETSNEIDPVKFMVSHTSGLLGAQARNLSFYQPGVDFLQMQQYRSSNALQNRKGSEKQKLVALATAADQLERRAEKKLYKYFIDSGINHQESVSRAKYNAKSQTDELLEDQRFQQEFANMYNAQISGH